MSQYLLDTHILLWWADDSGRLSSICRSLLEDGENQMFVSAVSVWEVSIKVSQRKLSIPLEPLPFFQKLIAENQFNPLPITLTHAAGVFRLPKVHNDPFDRLLISQARLEGLSLVSEDAVFEKYELPGLIGRG